MDPSNLDSELVSEMLSAMGKELKFARTRNKELETRVQSLLQRAEAAEHALGVMTRNFEETDREKKRLTRTVEEMRESKPRVKQETIEIVPSESKTYCEKSAGPDSDENELNLEHVRSLEEALELYYMKYKALKQSRSGMREEIKGLSAKLSDLDNKRQELETDVKSKDNVNLHEPLIMPAHPDHAKDIEELRRKIVELGKVQQELKSSLVKQKEGGSMDASSIIIPTSTSGDARMQNAHKNVNDFISKLPMPKDQVMRNELGPVCLTTMDLKDFILTDPKLADMAANLLCLPGRTIWCPPKNIHAIALGPMYIQKASRWVKDSAFTSLYGRFLHLFYTKKDEYVYYAGLFKIINLRERLPDGLSLERNDSADVNWSSLAEASTRASNKNVTHSNSILSNLYRAGALRAEPLGLQCMSLDMDVYHILRNRFVVVQSALKSVGKRGGYYPETVESFEGGEQMSKKRKLSKSQAGI